MQLTTQDVSDRAHLIALELMLGLAQQLAGHPAAVPLMKPNALQYHLLEGQLLQLQRCWDVTPWCVLQKVLDLKRPVAAQV